MYNLLIVYCNENTRQQIIDISFSYISKIFYANNTEEAIRLCTNNNIDIIISEDNFELYSKLRDDLDYTPVIIISGPDNPATVFESYATFLIKKPIDKNTLGKILFNIDQYLKNEIKNERFITALIQEKFKIKDLGSIKKEWLYELKQIAQQILIGRQLCKQFEITDKAGNPEE